MHRSRMLGILFEHGVRTVSQLDVHSYWQFIAEDLRWRIAVRQLRSFLPQFSSSPSMSSFFSIIYSTHFAVTSPIAMKIKTKDSSRFQGHSFTLSSGIFCGIDSLAGTCLVSHSVSRTFLLLRICRLCVSFVTWNTIAHAKLYKGLQYAVETISHKFLLKVRNQPTLIKKRRRASPSIQRL